VDSAAAVAVRVAVDTEAAVAEGTSATEKGCAE